ncbi:TPA: DUF551 domain-containing protein [Klebsiella pneumoniae]|nr:MULTISPECIES: DUF551 domain-containing protein [Klebsiella]MBC4084229.1 DUF551 domain-containing protein [Klebsiella pneumoniae]MDK7022947.1 DUF551 domain-containing protein [Klebsiella pneumoniae]HBR7354631.1 DUF551 domain-containing protein [Klebsiella pneumoniae]HBX3081235.1 DUF551 domain-containing protein [Klebsiella pneumoniae]HDG8073529.1 DUF551 domain-containing protein [Klebsiella pneumoniae]
MTSKLTREQLHERARENVKALKMASRQTAFESAREEILADLQLAELALAAMESEPVAWTDEEELRDVNDAGIGYLFGIDREANKFADPRRQIMLYRHAQQPVVPEEATSDSIEILASARRRDHAVFQWDEDQRNAAADSWNACRAAILAAAPQSPGSEPATVPGKWIPVRERMPPRRYEVLVGRWWGEKPRWCCKWATYIPGHPDSQSSGWLIPGGSWTPTHWMELPAAPQEVR